jgi:ubiquinone/menaquinone biosynthesis C-methylase UbiE
MHEGTLWTRESRFGQWFLSTDVWVKYVLQVAVADLLVLLGPRSGPYSTILDIGCGAGKALPALDAHFKPDRVIALDIDPAMIGFARREAAGCRCEVALKVGPATALDLPDASVDMVFCHQTFHHLRSPDRAAREFHRVLKPGGVLLFSESCSPFIRSLPVRILFRHPMDVQRSAREYLALLRSEGFAFTAENISALSPWWSRPDLGLREWLGLPSSRRRDETLVNVAAFRNH